MKDLKPKKKGESGFSLVEVAIAMVILLVGLLAVSLSYSSAVRYNAGNDLRLQALAILQQETEQLRNAKFTPTVTDEMITGGVKPVKAVTSTNGNTFQVSVTVDDDPFAAGVQINNLKTLKEITVLVTPDNQSQSWTIAVPVTVTLRRARSN